MLNRHGKVTDANPSSCAAFGYDKVSKQTVTTARAGPSRCYDARVIRSSCRR